MPEVMPAVSPVVWKKKIRDVNMRRSLPCVQFLPRNKALHEFNVEKNTTKLFYDDFRDWNVTLHRNCANASLIIVKT